MKALTQNLLQYFNAVVFGKDEFEFRDMSELKAQLQPLAYYNSNCDVKILY